MTLDKMFGFWTVYANVFNFLDGTLTVLGMKFLAVEEANPIVTFFFNHDLHLELLIAKVMIIFMVTMAMYYSYHYNKLIDKKFSYYLPLFLIWFTFMLYGVVVINNSIVIMKVLSW